MIAAALIFGWQVRLLALCSEKDNLAHKSEWPLRRSSSNERGLNGDGHDDLADELKRTAVPRGRIGNWPSSRFDQFA
jgi:hypothetical protein